MYTINLEVSLIPKDKIKQLESGKKFLNLILSEMQQPDKYGNTHTVFISQTKEERESKQPKIYVGKAKKVGQSEGKPAQPAPQQNNNESDDLPF